jgi:mRNA-degrading endonuclease toxin of MazEF toxin-antitoxin module
VGGRVKRGDVYTHPTVNRRFVVVSTNRLTEAGTVIVAEVSPEYPAGLRGMLAVALRDDDPIRGAVLGWRVNYVAAERLGTHLGRLSDETMEVVDIAVRTAMDL